MSRRIVDIDDDEVYEDGDTGNEPVAVIRDDERDA